MSVVARAHRSMMHFNQSIGFHFVKQMWRPGWIFIAINIMVLASEEGVLFQFLSWMDLIHLQRPLGPFGPLRRRRHVRWPREVCVYFDSCRSLSELKVIFYYSTPLVPTEEWLGTLPAWNVFNFAKSYWSWTTHFDRWLPNSFQIKRLPATVDQKQPIIGVRSLYWSVTVRRLG